MGWPANYDFLVPKLTTLNPRTRRTIPAHLGAVTPNPAKIMTFPRQRLGPFTGRPNPQVTPSTMASLGVVTLLPGREMSFELPHGTMRVFRMFVHSPTPVLKFYSYAPFYIRHRHIPTSTCHDYVSEQNYYIFFAEINEPCLGFWYLTFYDELHDGATYYVIGTYELYGGGYQHRAPNRRPRQSDVTLSSVPSSIYRR